MKSKTFYQSIVDEFVFQQPCDVGYKHKPGTSFTDDDAWEEFRAPHMIWANALSLDLRFHFEVRPSKQFRSLPRKRKKKLALKVVKRMVRIKKYGEYLCGLNS